MYICYMYVLDSVLNKQFLVKSGFRDSCLLKGGDNSRFALLVLKSHPYVCIGRATCC